MNSVPPTTSSPLGEGSGSPVGASLTVTPASHETAPHAPLTLSDTLRGVDSSQMQGLLSLNDPLLSTGHSFDNSYPTFDDLSAGLTFDDQMTAGFSTDVSMSLDPDNTSFTSTPASHFDFTLPTHSLPSGFTTPASTIGDLPDLSLSSSPMPHISSSPMPDTPITSWRKEIYTTPAFNFATPPRLRFRTTPTIATSSPSCAPFLASKENEQYDFGSATCPPHPPLVVLPASGAAVLAPPVESSASDSDGARDLDSALAPSAIEVAQVSEQPALLSSAISSTSGSPAVPAHGHCVAQADIVDVPALRKTKRVRQQTTRLAQANNIGNNGQKRCILLSICKHKH